MLVGVKSPKGVLEKCNLEFWGLNFSRLEVQTQNLILIIFHEQQ